MWFLCLFAGWLWANKQRNLGSADICYLNSLGFNIPIFIEARTANAQGYPWGHINTNARRYWLLSLQLHNCRILGPHSSSPLFFLRPTGSSSHVLIFCWQVIWGGSLATVIAAMADVWFENKNFHPGQCGSISWVVSFAPKVHVPRLWVRYPVGGMQKEVHYDPLSHPCFSLTPPSFLSENQFLKNIF